MNSLEITDDYIALTTRPVSALQVARLNSALTPLPIVHCFWAFTSTFCSLQLARLKHFLNIAPTSSNNSPQLSVGGITIDQLRRNSSEQETRSRAQMDKMSDPKSDEGSTHNASAKPASSNGSKIYETLPSLPDPGPDISPAVTEAMQAFKNSWQPPTVFGDRGTVVVRGQVELKGPRGSHVMEVVADYHPRDARYKTLRVGPKYFSSNYRSKRPPPNPKNE